MKEDALAQLNALSVDDLEKQCITNPPIETIADNAQDEEMLLLSELWTQLTKTSIDRKIVSYGELAIKLKAVFGYKIHHKKIMVLLEPITQFCRTYNTPILTYLAINDKLQLPKALEKETESSEKFDKEKIKIYSFDWDEQKKNFDLFLIKIKEE